MKLKTVLLRTLPALLALLAAVGLSGCGKFFVDTNTTTTLAASPSSVSFGDDLTLTVTVVPAAATGTVTFYDGSSSIGTGTLSGGTTTLTSTTLAVGSHSLTADYGGDSFYEGSDSAATTVTVTAQSTSLAGNKGRE